MKKTTITPTITITVILFFLATTVLAQATNFSGTWKRNDNQTDAGGLSINSVSASLEIIQDKGVITIKGTNKNGAGEVSNYTDVLKLDGSETERKAGVDQKKLMSVKRSPNGKQLISSSTYKDGQGTVTNSIKQTYSLSDDGKTLTVLDERNFDGQTYQLKDVFDKQ